MRKNICIILVLINTIFFTNCNNNCDLESVNCKEIDENSNGDYLNPAKLKLFAKLSNDSYDNPTNNVGSQGKYAYIIYHEENNTYIAIRGTSNKENVLTDIDANLQYNKRLGVYLHRGFALAAQTVYDDIKDLHKLKPTIFITGHSLGGAIALIISEWLYTDGYSIISYTYGSPKTSIEKGKVYHIRVVNSTDPVPLLPPSPFNHYGIKLNPIDLTVTINGQDDKGGDVFQHSITEYIRYLNKH